MSSRWQALARRKLDEADALIERAGRMKTLLGCTLNCGCIRLDDCAAIINRGMDQEIPPA